MTSITQRFLVLVSTASARNTWHNDSYLCIRYEQNCENALRTMVMSLATYASETNEHPENNKYKKNKRKKFVCFNSQRWFDSLTTYHESNLRKVSAMYRLSVLLFFFCFLFIFLTSLFIETLLFVRSRLRNWRDVMRHVNGLINSRGVHLILGVPAEVFNR